MPFLNQNDNSIEVRIPEDLIQQAGLANTELEFAVVEDGLLIKPVCRRLRQGWEEKIKAAILAHGNEIVDAEWLDAPLIDEDFDG